MVLHLRLIGVVSPLRETYAVPRRPHYAAQSLGAEEVPCSSRNSTGVEKVRVGPYDGVAQL